MRTPKELLTYFGISLAGWKTFLAKRLSSYKVPKSVRDEYLDSSGVYQEEAAFDAVAYITLQAVIGARPILNKEGVFNSLLAQDKLHIQNAIYFGTTFMTKNNTIYEIITGKSIQTGNFNAQIDTTRNIIDNDQLGTYTRSALKLSEIHKYKLIPESDEGKAYILNSQGERVLIAKIDDSLLAGGTP